MEQQPTSGSWFPSDLTSEILLRLPAKSVRRFRCVSKLWLSITTDPCFIKSFGSTRPSLLLCSIKRDNWFVTSTPQHTHDQSSTRSYSSSQPIHRLPMNPPGEHHSFPRMDSVHGLICMDDPYSTNLLIWNPSTDQLLLLPKHNMKSERVNMFLGYDSVECKHKVVCLPYRKVCYVCRVFTLRSGQQESWRTVRTNLKHMCLGPRDYYASGRCIKGVIYYLAHSLENDTIIMSFDVRSEIFRMIELPSGIREDVLISYKGRLACIDRKNRTRLWFLEDADKHKWLCQDFLVPLNKWNLDVSCKERNWNQDYLYNCFKLEGCTNAGEFIYVTSLFRKSSYIVFYDPVRNSCRRLKFEGIVDKKLIMHAFPNHIESLMSL